MDPARRTTADLSASALHDPGRLEELGRLGIMDAHGSSKAVLDRLTRLASELSGMPVALMSLIDARRQVFASALGLPAPFAEVRETPLTHSICKYVVADGEELVVRDVRDDEGLRDNLAVRDLGIVAYAGVPMRLTSGRVVGSFCVIGNAPHEFSGHELAVLEDLAAAAVAELELRATLRQAAADLRFATDNTRVLHMIGGEARLERMLAEIADVFERHHPGLRAAVVGLDEDCRRRTLAAPSLPQSWVDTADETGADCFDVLDPRLVVEEDLREHEAREDLRELAAQHGLAASWSAPVRSATHGVLGRFTVYAPMARPPSERETVSMAESAALAATAIERRRIDDDLAQQARRDDLTGLRNRRRLFEDLAAACAASDGRARTLGIFDLNGFKRYNDRYGHPAGDALLRRLGGRLAGAVTNGGKAYRLGGDEFCILVDGAEQDSAQILLRALGALSDTGGDFAVTACAGTAGIPRDGTTPDRVMREADARLYANKHARVGGRGESALSVLIQALRERDGELVAHVTDVADLAMDTARSLGLGESERGVIGAAARLHDIGKVGIPDRILDKPGSLDDVEWSLMRCHTLIGQRILASCPELAEVGRVVRATHERFDGGGYPDGIAGAAIPLAARIIAVCDAYDAMTTDRPYQSARPSRVAMAELRRCAGGQFDPVVVEHFCAATELAQPSSMVA